MGRNSKGKKTSNHREGAEKLDQPIKKKQGKQKIDQHPVPKLWVNTLEENAD